MKKLLIAALALMVGVVVATDIRYGYTEKSYSSTNMNAYITFEPAAMCVDIVNTSSNDVQFALNCPDASVFTNLYTNNICGIVKALETKRIQVNNMPISSIRMHSMSGVSNLVYITAL